MEGGRLPAGARVGSAAERGERTRNDEERRRAESHQSTSERRQLFADYRNCRRRVSPLSSSTSTGFTTPSPYDDDGICPVKSKFYGSSFLVASTKHPRGHARHVRRHPGEDATRMSRVSGEFPVQLATRLPDWLAGGLLRCSDARLTCVASPNSTSPTRTTCCGHKVASILVASSSDTSETPDFLVIC